MKWLLDKQKRNRQLQAHRWIISLSVATSLAWFSSSASSDNTGNSYRRLHQGGQWTATDWKTFYSLDQGSLIMPYAWMVALKEANGQLFLRDSLSRYGYLPNPKGLRNPEGLPLGFLVANKRSQTPEFSMNCAACQVMARRSANFSKLFRRRVRRYQRVNNWQSGICLIIRLSEIPSLRAPRPGVLAVWTLCQ
jgi:hypothetical protein